MPPPVIFSLLAVVLLVAVAGVVILVREYLEQVEILRMETLGARGGLRRTVLVPFDRWLSRTRPGRRLHEELTAAGVRRLLPAEVAVLVAGLVLVGMLLATRVVAPLWVLFAGAALLLVARSVLHHLQQRQRLAFLAQMPDLARMLANATGAGLSIRTALEMAAEELQEPASAELQRVVREMQVGAPLDEALLNLERRLPGRELSVLVGTLIISQRSGGSLITALRQIGEALEDRKELDREIRTQLSQSSYTGYLVAAMGAGMLVLINSIQPGMLRLMTETLLGQIALVAGGGLFAVGIILIRRMTRIEV
jgi:tight adherence protein B